MSAQLMLFLQSILLGVCLGLLYDLLRALRRRGGGPVWLGILDGLYAVAAASSLFFFVMTGDGELRLFVLAGTIGGAVLHFCLFSGPMAPLWDFWLGILLLPWRFLENFIKKLGSICKKLFSFWKRWFTIISTRHRRSSSAEKGEHDMATSTRSGRGPAAAKENTPRRRGGKLTMLLLFVMALAIVFQLRSMQGTLEAAKAEEAVYAARLEELQETNARLAMEIANSDDRSLLESIARDELGMAAPGEKIFRFN